MKITRVIHVIICIGIMVTAALASPAWEPVQQLTTLPNGTNSLAYNHARALASCGDSLFVAAATGGADNYALYLLRSFDGGDTWDAPLLPGVEQVFFPALAVDASGNIHCAAFHGYELILCSSADAGVTWTVDTIEGAIPAGYRGCENPDVDIDVGGNIHIVYLTATIAGGSGPVYYIRSTDNGSTWNGPTQLIPWQPYHVASWLPTLACASDGSLHIVAEVIWLISGAPVTYTSYLRSPDSGVTWDTLRHISQPLGAAAGRYSLDAHGRDTLAFVWPDYPDYDIYTRRSTDRGDTWTSWLQLSDPTGSSDFFPSLALDQHGGTHIVWEDWGFWGICYRYINSNWVPDPHTERLSELPTYFNHPHVHCDRYDRVHVVWTQGESDTMPYQVYYRRGLLPTHIDEHEALSTQPLMLDIYPTPFTHITVINYQATGMSRNDDVVLSIYDIAGRLVKQFNDPTIQPCNHVIWQGEDSYGNTVPAGVYFVRAQSGEHMTSKKVVFTK